MLSSVSFIVLHFTFMSMIHFEFIFVMCIRSVSKINFFWCRCPVVPDHLLKRQSYLYYIPFASSSKITWLYLRGSISELSLSSINLCAYSFIITTLSWLLYPYTKSWNRVVLVLWLCSLSILNWLFWVFCFSIQTLESVFKYPQNYLLEFLLKLH